MIESLAHFFSQPIQIQLMSVVFSVVFRCYPFLALFFFFAPFFAAFPPNPLPSADWFPDRREKIALAWAVFLLPLASLIVATASFVWQGYFDFITFALLTPSLCVFLTAIAGRRPFLYSLLVGFLFLAGSAACRAALFSGWNSPVQTDRWYLQIFVSFAVGGALFSGLCLFLLWRCMDRNPERWQAAPSE